ncbi:MAG TPA: thiamine pyrophosphate-binding protein [Caulobacteraceae bacterium]|jgi:thiamine pyrophosphate-dependent acetolactate synthase large subunit-like protein
MKVHEAIARCLRDNGVETIFGLMGDGNMFMCDSFIRDCGGEFVAASHEVGAALMALGYSTVDLGKKLGVASVTHGPGMVNTVTALLQGVKASTPMLLICGDVKAEDRLSLQKAPQRELAMVVGAGFEQVRSPKTAVADTAMAIRRAILERRPIVLNTPVDFDWIEVEYKPVRAHIPEARTLAQPSDDLDNAIGMIAAAKKPVIVAGRGACSPEARASILKLAKRIEAPMAQTLKAKDLFRGEDFDLGICGVESTEPAVETILASDCLIFFGASITKATSSLGAFVMGRRIVQINQEAAEIGKNVLPDVGVVGDPGGVADLIMHWLDEAEIAPSGGYTDELKHKLESYRFETGSDADYDNGTVDYRHALVRLEAILPQGRVLATDGGRITRRIWPVIRVDGPGDFVPALDFGSIGLGVSHAIGAAAAARGRPVVATVGDGAFMNGGLAEFNTAVRAKLDLIVVVANDSAYGAEHIKFERKSLDPSPSLFNWPEFADVAIALGGEGVTVRCDADWAKAEAAIKNRKAPLLIDVKLDPARISEDE